MIKKSIWGVLLLATSLFAQLKTVAVTPEFFKSTIKVIDIRTPMEWRETGIVKGAYTLMFFDEKGNYDVAAFKSALDKIVKEGETFALICRTGSRTADISRFLSSKFGYNVINLDGGMMKLMREGYRPVKYSQ